MKLITINPINIVVTLRCNPFGRTVETNSHSTFLIFKGKKVFGELYKNNHGFQFFATQ